MNDTQAALLGEFKATRTYAEARTFLELHPEALDDSFIEAVAEHTTQLAATRAASPDAQYRWYIAAQRLETLVRVREMGTELYFSTIAEQVNAAVIAMVNAESWEQLKEIVHKWGNELATEVAASIFSLHIARATAAGESLTVWRLRHCRGFLKRLYGKDLEELEACLNDPRDPSVSKTLAFVHSDLEALVSGEASHAEHLIATLRAALDLDELVSALPGFQLSLFGLCRDALERWAEDLRDGASVSLWNEIAERALTQIIQGQDHDSWLRVFVRARATRYGITASRPDIDEAVQHAAGMLDSEQSSRNGFLLASLLLLRDDRTSGDRELAISLLHDIVAAEVLSDAERDSRAVVLSDALHRRGLPADVDTAIQMLESRLAASKGDLAELHLARARWLRLRFDRDGNLEDLSEARDEFQRLRGVAHLDQGVVRRNLGLVLLDRYRLDGRVVDLNEAIAVLTDLGGELPVFSPQTPWLLDALGTALSDRYDITDDEEDLHRSIQLHRAALALKPGEADAEMLSNLGTALIARARLTNAASDTDEAVQTFDAALRIARQQDKFTLEALVNLGNALMHRFKLTADLAALRAAIDTYEEAYGHTPSPSVAVNFAPALRELAAVTNDHAIADRAAAILRKAFQDDINDQNHRNLTIVAGGWGDWAAHHARWEEAAEAYEIALGHFHMRFALQTFRSDKLLGLRHGRMPHDGAAYAYARMGRFDEAVQAAEAGRALLMSELLSLDPPGLTMLDDSESEVRAAYERAAAQLRSLREKEMALDDSGVSRGLLEHAIAELDHATAAIRMLPGFEDFARELRAGEIRAIAADRTLAYMVITEGGGLALLVTQQAVRSVFLPELTTDFEFLLAKRFVQHYSYPNRVDSFRDEIDAIGAELWTTAIGPILDAAETPEVVLLPSRLLSILPLEGAWTSSGGSRRYAIDACTISRAPNALSLSFAQRTAAATGAEMSHLMIDAPAPVFAPLLLLSRYECDGIEQVTKPHPTRRITGVEATLEEVLSAMPSHAMVHFSCHGRAHTMDPLATGLLLSHGQWLTAREVIDLARKCRSVGERIHWRLAVLSACETGMTGMLQANEVLGLSTALTQAGFAGVVAPLWSVQEASTLELMVRFYENVALGDAPTTALRNAQQAVRDSTVAEKLQYFAKRVPDLPNQWVSAELEQRVYTQPYYWAAFSLVGI